MQIHTPTDKTLIKSGSGFVTATGNGTIIDTLTYTRALFIINATTAAASTCDALVQEDSAVGMGSATTVTGSNIAQVIASTTAAVATVNVNLEKRKRYLRVAFTIAGTTTANATVILFNPQYSPPAQALTPISV